MEASKMNETNLDKQLIRLFDSYVEFQRSIDSANTSRDEYIDSFEKAIAYKLTELRYEGKLKLPS